MNNLEKKVRSSVGYYCKIFREDMGCTQKEVAIATGKSRRLISHFEHGESDNINVFLWYIVNGLFNYYGEDLFEEIYAMRYLTDHIQNSEHKLKKVISKW